MVGTWKCKQIPGQVLLIPTGPLSPPVFFNLYLLEPINFVPACNFLLMLWLFQLKTTRCCILPPQPVLGPLLCLFSQTWRDPWMLFHPQVCKSPDTVGVHADGHGQERCTWSVLASSCFVTEFPTRFEIIHSF